MKILLYFFIFLFHMCLRCAITLITFLFRLFNFFVLLVLPFLGLYYEDYLPFIYLFSNRNKNFISYKMNAQNNTKNLISQNSLYILHHSRMFSKVHKNSYKIYKNNYNWNTWFSLNYYSCINISVLERELKTLQMQFLNKIILIIFIKKVLLVILLILTSFHCAS